MMRAMLTKLLLLAAGILFAASAHAQNATPTKYLSAATTNATVVKNVPALLWNIVAINTTTTLYYLKFYNKATTPTCNSDAVVMTIPVPFGASNAGGGAVIPLPVAMAFTAGIGFCLTGGLADNDNTAAATGVVINLGTR